MHATNETLLLYGLGLDLEPAVEDALAAHLERCGGCRDRLDLSLAARFGEAADPGAADLAGSLRAAAAARAPAPPPPAPPVLAGKALGPAGEALAIWRRPDDPALFLVEGLEWAGRTLRIDGVPCPVDRFGRFRLASPDAERLAARLAAGDPPPTFEPC